jgi:hypothetical protein
MKRMTEITFETEELTTLKARRGFKGFCGGCNEFVEMLPVEAAAILTGLESAKSSVRLKLARFISSKPSEFLSAGIPQ